MNSIFLILITTISNFLVPFLAVFLGSVYVCYMSSSLDGLLHCTRLFFPIMMKIVSVTVASAFRVGILTLLLLVVSCVLCYARLLYAFMVPPSLFLTVIASMTSKCVFPVYFVFLLFAHTIRHFFFFYVLLLRQLQPLQL